MSLKQRIKKLESATTNENDYSVHWEDVAPEDYRELGDNKVMVIRYKGEEKRLRAVFE